LRRAAPALAVPAIALALFGFAAGDAQAKRHGATYVGGGHGIKVEFKLKGRKLIQARVVARVSCKTTRHRHTWFHQSLYTRSFASGLLPMKVNGRGRFRNEEEEWLGEEFPPVERISGQIGPRRMVGRFAVHWSSETVEARPANRETCQTGPLPGRIKELSFHAHRI
jgi:hypothetical protein